MELRQPGPRRFIDLADVPHSYSGAASEVATVNPGETGLIFQAGGGGGSITVKDGSTTVGSVTTINFTSGATVTNAGGGEADVAVSGGGGSPSAPDTSVQFNDSGNFGGDSVFTYDKTTQNIAINSFNPGGNLTPFNATAVFTDADPFLYGGASGAFSTIDTHTAGTMVSVQGVEFSINKTNSGDTTLLNTINVAQVASGGNITDSLSIRIEPMVASGSAVVTNAVGLSIGDVTQGTNSFAIQTGLGTVEIGDEIHFPSTVLGVLKVNNTSVIDADGKSLTLQAATGNGDGNGGDIILKPGDYPGGTGNGGLIRLNANTISTSTGIGGVRLGNDEANFDSFWGTGANFQSDIGGLSTAPNAANANQFYTAYNLQSRQITNADTTSFTLVGAEVDSTTSGDGDMNEVYGMDFDVLLNSTGNLTNAYGNFSSVNNFASTVSNVYGAICSGRNVGGVTTTVIGVEGQAVTGNASGSTVNAMAVHAVTIFNAPVPTNGYGILVDDVTGASSLNYAIKTGLGTVSFGDTVKIVDSSSAKAAIFNTASLSSDKTFTFPDQTGIIAATPDPGANTIYMWDDTDNLPVNAIIGSGLSYNHGSHTLSSLTAAITDTKSLTSQTADIADTAFTTTGVGLYRIEYYMLDTTADLTAGAVTLNIKYTDGAASRTVSSSPVILTATTGFTQGTIVAQLASGSLTYGVTHSGIFGTSAYALYLTVERII